MKTFKLIVISSILSLFLGQTAFAHDWRLVGNGGGGITDKHGTTSLYEKFKKLHWSEIDTADFVQLSRLHSVLVQLHIPPLRRDEIVNALIYKKYFVITRDRVSRSLIDRVTEIYSSMWAAPKNEITLFALTTVESDETLLLPDFFNLSENEQIAVLLHEALWTVAPRLTYSHMIEIESAFYNYLEQNTQHNEYRFYLALSKYVFNSEFLVQSVFLMNSDRPLNDVLGIELIHCLRSEGQSCSSEDSSLTLFTHVLKDFPNLRVTLIGYQTQSPAFVNRGFTYSDVYFPEDWASIWKKPYVNIPFFHRNRTCVQLNAPLPQITRYYLVVYATSLTEGEISNLCVDVLQD